MAQHELVVVVELEQQVVALRLHDRMEGENYFAIVAVDHHKDQLWVSVLVVVADNSAGHSILHHVFFSSSS